MQAICDQVGVAPDATFPYELCIREAISNAISHGQPGPPEEMLELTLSCPPGHVQLTLFDPGSQISFEQALKCSEDLLDCGRGFPIIRKFGTQLFFSPDGKTISITLPIYKKPDLQSPATPVNAPLMKTVQQDNHLSLQPEADLIAANIPDLRTAAKEAIKPGIETVHFNLESVKIVDSSGIGLIIALFNTLKKDGASLSVINASPDIVDLFKSMRLDQQFPVNPES
jgi:anti-anti-sigma factor